MANRFYVNCALAVGEVVLQGPEAHHLAAVCRLRPGNRVSLFNGDGRQYPAEVVAVAKKSVTLRVQGVETPRCELGFRLEVAAALPKGDRAHFLIEKLTELGGTTFVPLRTQRGVVQPHEGTPDKLQRWVIEASKQCGRNVLMATAPPLAWSSYCHQDDLPRRRYLAHPGGAAWSPPTGQDVAIAVGPEGGFTEAEVELAQRHDWHLVDLGPRLLRVETAAVALAASVALLGAGAVAAESFGGLS
ncbi:MAG: RsmE family RNA methyltransferase [Gemmataceae bacterium]